MTTYLVLYLFWEITCDILMHGFSGLTHFTDLCSGKLPRPLCVLSFPLLSLIPHLLEMNFGEILNPSHLVSEVFSRQFPYTFKHAPEKSSLHVQADTASHLTLHRHGHPRKNILLFLLSHTLGKRSVVWQEDVSSRTVLGPRSFHDLST